MTSIVLGRVISCILMTPNSGVTRSQKTRQRSFPFCFLSSLLNVFSFVVLSLSFSLSFLEASGKECLMKHHLDLTRKRVGEKRRKGEFGSRVRERICTSQSWSKAFVLFLFFSLNFRKIEFNRGSYSIRLD